MSVVASETLVAKQNKTGTSVLFHTVLSLMRPNRARWMLVVLLVLVQSASQLAPPIYYKLIFNRVVGGGDAGALPPLAAGMAAVFGVMVVVALVQASLCAELGMRAVNQLRLTLVQHIHRLDIDYFGRVRTGDVLARFSGDIGAIERIMTWSLHQIARDGLAALLCIAALFFVEWHLAALTLAMLPLVALIPRSIGRRAAVAGHARREDDGRLTSAVQETFAGHRVIRAFSIEQRHGQQFRALLQSVHANGRRANLLSALVEKSSDFGLLFTQLVIIGLGGYLVTRGFLTAGDLIAFFGLLLNASDALYGLSTLVPDFIQASTASRRIDELLAEAPEPGAARDAIGAPRLSQEIRFADVGFSYGKSVAVERASFVVGAGQSVALVGRSGSGKSTILSLIMRFHDPTIGKITVDGRDLASIDPASWRAQIGCVFQSTFLFDLSVRENIRQGRLDASDAAVESAARAAMIHENILELPQGYDTLLGESGGRLSGGQQQRLALARDPTRSGDPDLGRTDFGA